MTATSSRPAAAADAATGLATATTSSASPATASAASTSSPSTHASEWHSASGPASFAQGSAALKSACPSSNHSSSDSGSGDVAATTPMASASAANAAAATASAKTMAAMPAMTASPLTPPRTLPSSAASSVERMADRASKSSFAATTGSGSARPSSPRPPPPPPAFDLTLEDAAKRDPTSVFGLATPIERAQTERILDHFDGFRLKPDNELYITGGGRLRLAELLLRHVRRQQPIPFVLPAFPFKSPNAAKKVIGVLPDRGEELAFERLNVFTAGVAAVYPPGAYTIIFSDGRVFNDMLGVPDYLVDLYGSACRQMTRDRGFHYLRWDSLDAHIPFDPAEAPPLGTPEYHRYIRDKMVQDGARLAMRSAARAGSTSPAPAEAAGETATAQDTDGAVMPVIDIDKLIRDDPAALAAYRGFIKFLQLDLENVFRSRPESALWSRSRIKKECGRIGKVMLRRNHALANFVTTVHPDAVRLSIHMHSNSGPKYGVVLLNNNIALAAYRSLHEDEAKRGEKEPITSQASGVLLRTAVTPWHNTTLEIATSFTAPISFLSPELDQAAHTPLPLDHLDFDFDVNGGGDRPDGATATDSSAEGPALPRPGSAFHRAICINRQIINTEHCEVTVHPIYQRPWGYVLRNASAAAAAAATTVTATTSAAATPRLHTRSGASESDSLHATTAPSTTAPSTAATSTAATPVVPVAHKMAMTVSELAERPASPIGRKATASPIVQDAEILVSALLTPTQIGASRSPQDEMDGDSVAAKDADTQDPRGTGASLGRVHSSPSLSADSSPSLSAMFAVQTGAAAVMTPSESSFTLNQAIDIGTANAVAETDALLESTLGGDSCATAMAKTAAAEATSTATAAATGSLAPAPSTAMVAPSPIAPSPSPASSPAAAEAAMLATPLGPSSHPPPSHPHATSRCSRSQAHGVAARPHTSPSPLARCSPHPRTPDPVDADVAPPARTTPRMRPRKPSRAGTLSPARARPSRSASSASGSPGVSSAGPLVGSASTCTSFATAAAVLTVPPAIPMEGGPGTIPPMRLSPEAFPMAAHQDAVLARSRPLWAHLPVTFERLRPFGLLVRADASAAGRPALRDVPWQSFREFGYVFGLVVLRGFAPPADAAALEADAASLGPLLRWPHGVITDVVERAAPRSNQESREAMPFHFDGMFKFVKTVPVMPAATTASATASPTASVPPLMAGIPDVPQFQFFRCAHASAADENDGLTLFTDTRYILRDMDGSCVKRQRYHQQQALKRQLHRPPLYSTASSNTIGTARSSSASASASASSPPSEAALAPLTPVLSVTTTTTSGSPGLGPSLPEPLESHDPLRDALPYDAIPRHARLQYLSSQILGYGTPCTGRFGSNAARLYSPLVVPHPVTAQPVLRFHEPWDQSRTQLQPVEVTPLRHDPYYRNLNAGRLPPVNADGSTAQRGPAPPMLPAPLSFERLTNALTNALYDRERYCYAHRWEQDDYVLADNYALLHTRTAYRTSSRHLQRIHIY
ncbi:hypothetical protein CXG81DRAFT_24016 [Caulochytrium protostelioides]|uniref:TauD/TfdA-like domain-containing protein n=1 Tax=Caulochytrium protostelioides TaxID=1555241 RepID=A0A4P9XDZ9_9FUNG|nr:hypothetical protein CXG81DRAFT_24016 [Caulochytrium protostelioides]|eukprot:RKP03361.1 hypothetical protein CXG81DRAFT_24016 [Caulochytrium protostelioides]